MSEETKSERRVWTAAEVSRQLNNNRKGLEKQTRQGRT